MSKELESPIFEERDDGWYYYTSEGWVGPFDDAREADCHHEAWCDDNDENATRQ